MVGMGVSGRMPAGPVPAQRTAGRFIWLEGEAKPPNFYLYARRSFELAEPPSRADIHITASDRYLLYINGVQVGRGPARADPRRKSYDSYDLRELLAPGRNVIAVRAYHSAPVGGPYGWGSWCGGGYSVGERAGLWAQVELEMPDGESAIVATDSAWRVRPALAWDRNAQLINNLVGWNEVYDAAADPCDWMAPDFDDSGWESAWEVPGEEYEWFLLEPRLAPYPREEEHFPRRLVHVGEVIDLGRSGQTDIHQLLSTEPQFPLEHARAENAEAVLVGDGSAAELQGCFAHEQGIRAPFLIVDFGRQLVGFPRVRLEAQSGAILDLTYGQQLINGRIPAALEYGDRYIARDGEQTWQVAEYKQFRYLHLGVRSTYAPVRIRSISVNEYRFPHDPRGRFECSDELITSLWQACLDTNALHMEDTIVCDAYRERVCWCTGDGSHGVHMVYAAWGDTTLSDQFLRLAPFSDRGDGMLQMAYPPENPGRYVHPQFLLQWPTRVREHYLFTGRRAVLEELYPSVRRQIDWYAPHLDAGGLLRDLPRKNVIEWTPNDSRGTNFHTNVLYVAGLEDAAWLADHVGETADAERWRSSAAAVRATLQRMFWNDSVGLYEDAHYQGRLTGVVSELGNAYALLYDIATPDQRSRIGPHFERRNPDLVPATPLFYGYVAAGLLRAGFDKAAVGLMRDRFRRMLEVTDNPTIWEGWGPFTGGDLIRDDAGYERRETTTRLRPAGVRSHVHSGGGLVGYALATRVLGIRPAEPGFAACVIHPRPGDLEWAKGVMPSPHGDIGVHWTRRNGGLTVKAEVPDGVRAEILLDSDPHARRTLSLNGEAVSIDAASGSSRSDVAVEPGRVRVRVGAGSHRCELGAAQP